MSGEPRTQDAAARGASESSQLDLFVDGRDAVLVHAVVTRLLARDREGAERHLDVLRREQPAHPDLPTLGLLAGSLGTGAPPSASHASLAARIETMDRALVPGARRLLGADATLFLRPLWRELAIAAKALTFDDAYPRAHASWISQQGEDWEAVRAAVEAEPDWAVKPLLRYRLGLARYHLGEPEAAIQLWLPLCWIDPALFARHAPAIPSGMVRDGWDAFEHVIPFAESSGDTTDNATWFPAWLLVRHRGLAHLFQAADVPDAGIGTQVFRALLTLLALERHELSDEVVAQRRALQRLSPEFFAYYMQALQGRRPRAAI